MELPIEFFLAMAWDPKAVSKDRIAAWTEQWARREFGTTHAHEVADLVSRYTKYNAWRKPEQLRPDTYSLENYREAERMVALWTALRARAEAVNTALPDVYRAAYYQLVLHPIRGCCNLNEMLAAAGRNRRFADQGRASANVEAAEVRRLFAEAHRIRDHYNHDLSEGKWNHLMDQTYIGYSNWFEPPQDISPPVSELDLPDTAKFGVAIDGSAQVWPGYYLSPALPVLDSLLGQTSWIEVFARGKHPVAPQVVASEPWILLTLEPLFGTATSGGDRRFRVAVDWSKLPPGRSNGTIRVGDPESTTVIVKVAAVKASSAEARAAHGAWGSQAGAFTIPANGFSRNVHVGKVRWEAIPDYGRVDAAMSIFPTNTPSFPDPRAAPRLEYPVYLGVAGTWHFDLVTAPTMRVNPDHRLSLAMWIDDAPPTTATVFTPEGGAAQEFLGKGYEANARNDMRVIPVTLEVATPGCHLLNLAMIDPTIVVQSIIAYRDALPSSYFGPPPMRIGYTA